MTTPELYLKKKRRVLGEILQAASLKNTKAWVTIRATHEFFLTYESQGLVVALNGGGSLPADHPQVRAAVAITSEVVGRGGLIINGGRDEGLMAATAKAAGDHTLGILFPELKKQMAKMGATAIVNSPTPRTELLATCAPVIVIFRGGLGTFSVLMRSIVHSKNRRYHPEQLPQLVFVSDYWIGLLSTMVNLGTLPKDFVSDLHFFQQADQLLAAIPPLT